MAQHSTVNIHAHPRHETGISSHAIPSESSQNSKKKTLVREDSQARFSLREQILLKRNDCFVTLRPYFRGQDEVETSSMS